MPDYRLYQVTLSLAMERMQAITTYGAKPAQNSEVLINIRDWMFEMRKNGAFC
jgi:hypothetical protein